MDAGGIGELVARIVLLLAMDACGVILKGDEGKRCYAGEFYSVADFLRALHGESPAVEDPSGVKMRETPDVFLSDWEDWQVGFSHFVQLHKAPTQDCLWAKLERRAACALPRNFKGVDLVIPIFKKGARPGDAPQVSMILIQVKNRQDGDRSFPDSAVIATRPSVAFKKNKRMQYQSNNVVRIYMGLRGAPAVKRFYILDPGLRRSARNQAATVTQDDDSGDNGPPGPPKKRQKTVRRNSSASAAAKETTALPSPQTEPKPFVLCLFGLSGYNAVKDAVTTPVQSDGVADELKLILEPWWKIQALVKEDIKDRTERGLFGLSEDAMLAIAMRPLAENLLDGEYPTPPVTAQPPQTATNDQVASPLSAAAEHSDDSQDGGKQEGSP